MRNILVIGAIAACSAAPAMAQEFTVAGNIAIATDYTFRGLSQTDSHPAVQGGFDAAFGGFYVGTWASNVDFGFGESIELDLYGGYKLTAGPVALDLGVIGYLYPAAGDDGLAQVPATGELDYYEGYVKAGITPVDGLSIGGAFYYSPDFTAETGAAYYGEINAGYAITPMFSVSGAYGYQDIEDIDGVFAGTEGADYSTYNVGGTATLAGISLDLRYVGNSIDDVDPIITSAFTSVQKADDRVIFSIKKAM